MGHIRSASITKFEVISLSSKLLNVVLNLNVSGVRYKFCSEDFFTEIPNCYGYTGYFLHRILQITDSETTSDIVGKEVQVEIAEGRVIALGKVAASDHFNPLFEFELRYWKDFGDVQALIDASNKQPLPPQL